MIKRASSAGPSGRAGSSAKAVARTARRWLLFVHQLPSSPSNVRVRTWRRLQQLGAIVVKQAVYVLPDSAGAREDFEWLKTEIESAGGQASVFAANSVDTWSDDALIEEFRRSKQTEYARLARNIERASRPLGGASRKARRAARSGRSVEAFRQRLERIERTDFFGSAGRDRVVELIDQLGRQSVRQRARPPELAARGRITRETFVRRQWVTRPRPGVDRMASAWLIRRFIDPQATFKFSAGREFVAPGAIPFDMFGVEFSHHGEQCTFETLSELFEIDDPAVSRLAGLVHDLDLKDDRFHPSESPAIGAVIEGLQLAHAADDELLEHGMTLFEALYRRFRQTRPRGPRPVARTRTRRKRSTRR
jgi:hypothetical protein